jgi:hypothetical protein
MDPPITNVATRHVAQQSLVAATAMTKGVTPRDIGITRSIGTITPASTTVRAVAPSAAARVVGSRGIGAQTVGSRAVGARAVGARAVGARAVGARAVGGSRAMIAPPVPKQRKTKGSRKVGGG